MNRTHFSKRIICLVLTVVLSFSISATSIAAGLLEQIYKKQVIDTINKESENAYFHNYRGEIYPGMFTLVSADYFYHDTLAPSIAELRSLVSDDPTISQFNAFIEDHPEYILPLFLYLLPSQVLSIPSYIHSFWQGFFYGDDDNPGSGLDFEEISKSLSETVSSNIQLAQNTQSNDLAYVKLGYRLAQSHTELDPLYHFLLFSNTVSPFFYAETPGDYADLYFDSANIGKKSISNRYNSIFSNPQYDDPSKTYSSALAFSPSRINYNNDGTMMISLGIINQTGNPIVITGFDRMTISDDSDTPIFDAKNISTDYPAIIFSNELETSTNGSVTYGDRPVTIKASPGTYDANVNLQDAVGKVYAAPIYEEITFQDIDGNTVEDPSHNIDKLITYTTASGETHTL